MEEADRILPKVQKVLAIVDEVFNRYGFTINYSKGKTEVMLVPAGPGSSNLWRDIQSSGGHVISFQSRRGCQPVCITNNYKHVGTLEVVSSSMGPEITRKVAVLRSSMRPLRSKFLTNPKVDLGRRVLVGKAV
eukprot:7703205-Karenia_brevis.AAC.1